MNTTSKWKIKQRRIKRRSNSYVRNIQNSTKRRSKQFGTKMTESRKLTQEKPNLDENHYLDLK